MSKMKCHVRIEITHSKRGVTQGFTTHSALETLHNPTLVVCYFYILSWFVFISTYYHGIVFTHGVRMGGRAGGRAREKSLSGLYLRNRKV